MSTAIITKSALCGELQAPSSKSVAHRMMICAALSHSKCYIKNVSQSDDMRATIKVLETLGAKFTIDGTTIFCDATTFVEKNCERHFTLDCKESGTTLRIMIPICAALGLNVTFTGSGRLPLRPLDEYLRLLPQHGVSVKKGENFLPLSISGKLCGEVFEISPKVSSQYVSGLIFALSLLNNDTTLRLTDKLLGAQYVDITTNVMSKFSVSVKKSENSYFIKGNQRYICEDAYKDESVGLCVEGDWSQAAFFLCGGAINGDVKITNLDINSTQGDKKIIDILKALGADITLGENCVYIKSSVLHGAKIDALDTPDLVPVVAVTCCYADSDSIITGVSRLKFKESDRLKSTCDMINSLGGEAHYSDDSIVIKGVTTLKGGEIDSYNDHRIVMSSAIGALMCENDTVINDAHAVNKSYAHFFSDYCTLGGKANVIMG